ncbi:FMN-binding negative transcriptional regulator [Bailinhaonella thermotolerans]|uniref:FMN-binding negative transcriptional regulator n=1 Tax=Bailinhaonella thermotolerans TaxID=1070861 RepID=A0A3A4APF2_9ACTN|nr:FMN-binding negative transcriptional regulator [Bailinhaonella thermotolerans]RJL30911.1 FMN-binding negative transcriptional regulator [Bailinhaonella thermotolerans]
MLILPWDAAVDDGEWKAWLAGRDFGQLTANGVDGGPPVVVPTPFLFDGDATVLLHFARPNPVFPALAANPAVTLSVFDQWAYVPTTWRAPDDSPDGVPTQYYAAVQLVGRAEVVDDREGKAEILRAQLAHHQPDGDHGLVAVDEGPYRKMLSAIRGVRLRVDEVRAKFKYDDHKPAAFRARIADRLAERGLPGDAGARAQQLRRLDLLTGDGS